MLVVDQNLQDSLEGAGLHMEELRLEWARLHTQLDILLEGQTEVKYMLETISDRMYHSQGGAISKMDTDSPMNHSDAKDKVARKDGRKTPAEKHTLPRSSSLLMSEVTDSQHLASRIDPDQLFIDEEELVLEPRSLASLLLQRKTSCSSRRISLHESWASESVGYQGSLVAAGCFVIRPLHPNNRLCAFFESMTLVVLLFESIMVPWTIAWNVPMKGRLALVSSLFLGFWIIDLMMSFVVGAIDKNQTLVMEFRAIARQYIRSWFLLDLVAVCLDAFAIILPLVTSSEQGHSQTFRRVVRLAKVGRFFRSVAKLRVGFLAQMDKLTLKAAGALDLTQHISFVSMFCRLIVLIAWLSHIGSCVWYFFGYSLDSPDLGWHAILEQEMPENESWGTLAYTTGLYWSISSMFAGASFLRPRTTAETIFSAVYILITSLFATSITSSLAAMLVRSQMQQQAQKEDIRTLYMFLNQQNVTQLLSVTITQQVVERMTTPTRLSENDVPALKFLSTSLRADLRCSLYLQHFTKHPVFRMFQAVEETLLQQVVGSVISHAVAQPGSELFTEWQPIDEAYIVLRGCLEYSREDVVDSPLYIEEHGSWICEVALWLHWQTHGLLQAIKPTELLVLGVEGVHRSLLIRPDLIAVTQNFIAKLCETARRTHRRALTDFRCDIDIDVIVASMSRELRQTISQPALVRLHHQNIGGLTAMFHKKKGRWALDQEVEEGKCHLMSDELGQIVRVVQLVLLRVCREDGLQCVNLARQMEGSFTPLLDLPGGKLLEGESLDEAMIRIAQSLEPAIEGIEITEWEVFVEEAFSARFGLPTKYIKLVGCATATTARETISEDHADDTLVTSEDSAFSSADRMVHDSRWRHFVLESTGGGARICAWMSKEEFQRLTNDHVDGKAVVADWLKSQNETELITPSIWKDTV